jgi:hypothetical protein
MIRKYFSHNTLTNTNEQNVIADLVRETIQISGMDVVFIRRTRSNIDTIFQDAERNSVTDGYTIEMYLQDTEGFAGEGDLITRFGMEVRDECTLTVAVDRFESVVGTGEAPKVGDLIYLYLSNQIYQITWVEDQIPFFMIGKTYVYELSCQLFNYADEEFDTGIAAVDALELASSYSIDLTMAAGGTGTFTVGGGVYQGSIGSETAKAEVSAWDSSTRILRVINISGTFAAATIVTDGTASWTLESFDAQTLPTSDFAQNLEIESAESGVVDFTESNPFGTI